MGDFPGISDEMVLYFNQMSRALNTIGDSQKAMADDMMTLAENQKAMAESQKSIADDVALLVRSKLSRDLQSIS